MFIFFLKLKMTSQLHNSQDVTVFIIFKNMAGSIVNNATLYNEKKKAFTYVPPSPPAELIESTFYTLDFTARKFIIVGMDPTEQLQTVVILLTSSRYVKISTDFLKQIFSLMGNVLSFILDTPQNYRRTIFLETSSYKISSMVCNSSNALVIESKTEDGCRVLLNRIDLIKLQELECCITTSISEKETNIKPVVIRQISDYCEYLRKKCLQSDSPPNDSREMEIFIRNVEVRQSMTTPNLSHIKMLTTSQLVELCMTHRNTIFSKYEVSNDGFNEMDYDDSLAKLQYAYSPISPNYSPDNNISSNQESIDENDEYDSDNFAQYPPWHHNSDLYLRQRALVVDENDGPTSFSIQSSPPPPSILDFTSGKPTKKLNKRDAKRKLSTPSPSFFDKPSTSKRGAQHLTPLD
ncbi:hypothetical protein QTP88_012543 [Uroleucon formosanum]